MLFGVLLDRNNLFYRVAAFSIAPQAEPTAAPASTDIPAVATPINSFANQACAAPAPSA